MDVRLMLLLISATQVPCKCTVRLNVHLRSTRVLLLTTTGGKVGAMVWPLYNMLE